MASTLKPNITQLAVVASVKSVTQPPTDVPSQPMRRQRRKLNSERGNEQTGLPNRHVVDSPSLNETCKSNCSSLTSITVPKCGQQCEKLSELLPLVGTGPAGKVL